MTVNLLIDTTRDLLMFALLVEGENRIYPFRDTSSSHRYHSAILIPQIQAALQQAQQSIRDISGVAVNRGPGSFTGIRTGLTVARLLGQFTSASTYGFNTFELVAGDESFRNQPVTLLLNAFRQRHYRAALHVDDHANVTWLSKPDMYENVDRSPIETPLCLVDASLQGKLEILHPNPQWLNQNFPFTPGAMAFYLNHHPERYLCPWRVMLPVYLQLPHITTKAEVTRTSLSSG